jgi:P27 family predicted phage terminase small subunit
LPTGSEGEAFMPGPKRIPTHLKLLRGNPGHQVLNKHEPQPTIPSEAPEPPSFLLPAAKDEWWRVSGELHVLGLLSNLDVHVLAAYCQAYARWQQAEQALAVFAEKDPATHGILIKAADGNARVNPLLKAANAAAEDMVRFASEFGMTPAARARVAAGIAWRQDKSKFDGLLA